MASSTGCGAELTGGVCSQCGAPATGAPRRRRVGPVIKWVLIVSVGIVILCALAFPYMMCPGGWYCSDISDLADAAVVGERETVQTIIESMMVDNDLSQVKASTAGRGGEKINSTGAQFHAEFDLYNYMYWDQPATWFCYSWDTDGRIIFQYDVDDEGNCAIDAEQLYP